jgi:hypothetical protein
MEMVLGADLTSRQAYTFIVPVLLDIGYKSDCESLVDLLTVTLVKPSATNIIPLTLQPCVGSACYISIPAVVSHHRHHLLYQDLHALMPASTTNPASDLALLDVARGMRYMITEARLDHNDRTDARDVDHRPRTTRERLGDAITDRLLLL